MDEEDKTKLKQIKAKILDELVDLSDSDDIPAEERFELMINRASGTTNVEFFGKAHDVALQIEDPADKARSLMDLMEEIDISLGNITVSPAPQQQVDDQKNEESKEEVPKDEGSEEQKPPEENQS